MEKIWKAVSLFAWGLVIKLSVVYYADECEGILAKNFIISSSIPDTMEQEHTTNVKWNWKNISLFVILLGLPNLLSLVNFPFAGFMIHTFQVAIFLAAYLYGPQGGLFAGLFGSSFSAYAMANPFIIGGNAILGFFTGLFYRKGFHPVLSALMAFGIQIPWLIVTDYYLVHLSPKFITTLIIALLISNVIWSFIASHLKKLFEPHIPKNASFNFLA